MAHSTHAIMKTNRTPGRMTPFRITLLHLRDWKGKADPYFKSMILLARNDREKPPQGNAGKRVAKGKRKATAPWSVSNV